MGEGLYGPQVKICGLTSVQEALACAEAGADAVGCVFFPPSPRHVTDDQARSIVEALPGSVCGVGVFVNFLRIPYAYLTPTILTMMIIGVYGVNTNAGDILLMVLFGIIGYGLRKSGFDIAPLILAAVLGDKLEMSFRRALTISEGSLWIFVKSSFSAVFLAAVLLIVALQAVAWLTGFQKAERDEA